MPPGWHTQEPVGDDALPLEKNGRPPKALLRAYYDGRRLSSPMGGFLEPLRVRSESDGSGSVLFECSSSSLRFRLHIPRATRRERQAVKERIEAGEEPTCPRHVDPVRRLQRVGGHLVCPLCGVRYARAE